MLDDRDKEISTESTLPRWLLQIAIPLLCGTAALLLAYQIYQQQMTRMRADERQLCIQRSQRIAATVQHAVEERILRTAGLVQLVAVNPNLTNDEFSDYAAKVLEVDAGLKCAALVRGVEIQTTYSVDDAENPFVEMLTEELGQTGASIETLKGGDPALFGPLNGPAGIRAYVLRLPVMLTSAELSGVKNSDDATPEYWGHVAVIIDLKSLVANVTRDVPVDLQISLQQIDPSDEEFELLYGEAISDEAECINSSIPLPGVTWTLGLIPREGWPARLPDHNVRLLAAAVLCGFSAFISWLFLRFHLLRSQHVEQLESAQQSAQLAQARLQLALIRGNIGLWDLHPESGEIIYSGTYKAMLRESGSADWSNTLSDWEFRLHPDDRTNVRNSLNEFLDGQETHYQAEYRLRCGDGLYRWFRTEATGTGQRGTAEHRVMGVLIDVSEDRESRERLQDERHEIQLILDSIPSLVILRDVNDRILRVNEAVVRATGIEREALKGKLFQEVIPHGVETDAIQEEGIVRSSDARSNDVQLFGDRWVQTQAVPITNSKGWTNRTIIVSTDITDLKQAEQSQEKASRFQVKVGELARIGGWDLDLVTNELTWSDMVKQIHEVPADYQPDIKSAIEFYRDDAREQVQAVIDRSVADESSWDIELPMMTAKGRQIYVRAMGQPVFENGRCVGLWGVFQDVTKLRQETELRDALFRNGPNACFLFSEDGILECNPPALNMLRAESKAELLQHHPAEFSPEYQPCGTLSAEKWKVMDAAAKERGVHRFEWLHRRMDGEEFPCEVTLSHVEIDSASVLLAAWRDLSEQKATERERDGFFALSLDLFCVIDEHGRFKRVNSAWRQVQGPDIENLPGVSVAELAIDEHRASTEQMLFDLAESGRVTEFRNKVKWKDGSDRWLEWNALVAANDDKVFFAVARDVTERIESVQQLSQLNEELQGANEALQQSNVDLQQFAYVASHDLQTPLRGIAGFAQMLVEDYADQLDEDANNYLSRITSGTQRMQRLIQDLLQYSRIEIVGQELTPIDLNQVVDDILVLLESDIAERNAVVRRDELPTILGDSSQLFQLFTNIINNGIKYNNSETPEVIVKLETAGESQDEPQHGSDNGWLEITVRDNGIGIEPEFQSQIFEVFRRLHTQREYSGTGIGLAICKRVMQRHEGEIWVTGKPDEGSCFHLRFSSLTAEI